jgi:UPF0755 protein
MGVDGVKAFFYTLLALATLAAGTAWWATATFTEPGPLEQPVTIVFPPGDHFSKITDTLAEKGVINHPLIFEILVFARGESSKFKAGEYVFPANVSPRDVALLMASGKTVMHHLTIPEGLMTSEILELVKHAPALDGEITMDIKEGELLPETYYFSRGEKRNEIIIRMRHAMQKTLDEAWAGRMQGLPFSGSDQALTLASIVEKETGLPGERPHVAAVYINRLRKVMLLQADPTTAYAVTLGKHKLTRPLSAADLALVSPYNTYRSPGLPPGPIANPGKASILAVMHPLASEDLYFVATGTGGHNFARTPEEHAANVRKYRATQHTEE